MYYFRQPIFVKKIFSTLRVDNRPQTSDSSTHKNSIDYVNFPTQAHPFAFWAAGNANGSAIRAGITETAKEKIRTLNSNGRFEP
jgi:hypothetical protein